MEWNWTPNCQEAFDKLKHAFTHALILTHWEPNQLLIVEINASNYAIAAILSITLEDNQVHPVAFLSQTLQSAELNYNTHNKGLLTIFEAFLAW